MSHSSINPTVRLSVMVEFHLDSFLFLPSYKFQKHLCCRLNPGVRWLVKCLRKKLIRFSHNGRDEKRKMSQIF